MKIKNRNGVTITVLVITIVVMLILFGITFSSSTDLLKNSQKNKMKTMLYMVQSRAEILLDDYTFDMQDKTFANDTEWIAFIESKLGGTYISNGSNLSTVGFESTIPDKNEMIYCSWNENTMESQGIDTKNLAKGDTIIIQYNITDETVEVASTKGFSKNGVGIHKLSEFEQK